jgi:hypothetical protein
LTKFSLGKKREEPVEGDHYVMGVDLARKTDFSVVTIMDNHGNVVCGERFNQISWSLQVERVALLYRTFRCTKAVVDSTGVGDAVIEQLEAQGLAVEPYIFTVASRRMLLEELILACDNAEISVPVDGDFKRYREKLEAFEYQLDGQTIRYAVPNSMHDDCAFSLALATHAYRASRGAVLGMLDLLIRRAKQIAEGIRDKFGELVNPKPEPKPIVIPKPAAKVATCVEGFQLWLKNGQAPACTACGATCTTFNSSRKVFCNQCHAVDGKLPEVATICECGNFLPQVIPSGVRCGNCGWQSPTPVIIGATFAQYNKRRNRFSWR